MTPLAQIPRAAGPRIAMTLAAGRGTRMRELTASRPKPLLEVGGRTLLDRTLDRLEEVGVERSVVNIHYLGEQIRAHLHLRRSPNVTISDESVQLLETGGGVRAALPLIGAPEFFVANSDNIWIGDRALAPLPKAWRPDEMDALLLLAPVEKALGYTRAGDFFLEADGRLRRRGEASSAPYVYTGAQILTDRAFFGAPSGAFSLNAVWDALIAGGRAFGVVHDAPWADVGTPEGIEIAAQMLRAEAVW